MNMEYIVLRFLGSNLTVPFQRANTCVCALLGQLHGSRVHDGYLQELR